MFVGVKQGFLSGYAIYKPVFKVGNADGKQVWIEV